MAHNSHPIPVVTRFAPSPTGFLHIGSIRTALFAYIFARQTGGSFILRIEDTDKNREVPGSIAHIQESLQWLGITWDYGPDRPGPFGSCIQSERLPVYERYAQQLVEQGLAYSDPYSDAEIESFKQKAIANKRPFLYRDHRPTERPTTWDKTKPLRLFVKNISRSTWHDAVRGDLSAGEEMLDDFVIMKSDGYPTYNFAHIIDDYEMGITHVMRGDEFISSTPKYLALYDALNIPRPIFVTMPPIMRDDGKKKLGKRDGAKDVLDYRTEGYLPEAMVNFLALIGWNPGTTQELFSMTELIENFSIEKIQRGGGAFDQTKLLWMNKQYLDTLSNEAFLDYLKVADTPIPIPATWLQRAIPTIRERTNTRHEFIEAVRAGEYDFLISQPEYNTELLPWKTDTNPADVLPRLQTILPILETASFTSPEAVKDAIWEYAESIGKGQVLWPLRVALSGKERSPDPFTIAYIIDREETLQRIRVACGKIVE